MINDVYNYEEYAVRAHGLLVSDGLDAAEAQKALEIFFKTFGFPGYREMDRSKVSTLSDTIGSNFQVEYEGEVQNGREYGVGTRTCYSNGKTRSALFDEHEYHLKGIPNTKQRLYKLREYWYNYHNKCFEPDEKHFSLL